MEFRKDRFASDLREIEISGVEIDPGNEAKREGDQISVIGAGFRLECETVQNEAGRRKKEESIIKPMRLAKASSLEKK